MGAVLYIHGRGGSAAEAERFAPLFPDKKVVGLDYKTFTPWEAGAEIRAAVTELQRRFGGVILIANSIGAFFALNAGVEECVEKAYFISPVVDMEKLIRGMMALEGVSEAELKEKDVIVTTSGEELSWEYLHYVREHPIRWNVPTRILYGENDALVDYETISAFAEKHGSDVTVIRCGEHWFHTPEQLAFLDGWIADGEAAGRIYG